MVVWDQNPGLRGIETNRCTLLNHQDEEHLVRMTKIKTVTS